MFNGQYFVLAAAMTLVAGCATLQEMPPPHAGVSGACPARDHEGDPLPGTTPPTPRPPQQQALCGIIRNIEARSHEYGDRHESASNERLGVQGLTIAGALAGAGFAAFDAHQDNIDAAGLVTAGGLLLDRGLNMRARVDILRSGVLSMNCYAGVGNVFAVAYLPGSGGGTRTVPASIETLLTAFAGHLVTARQVLASTPNAGEDQAVARAALAQAVTRSEAVIADLVKARRAMGRIPDDLDASWRAADMDLAKRLDGVRPDLTALVREAQQLAAGLNPPAGTPTAPPPVGGARGSVAASDVTDILASLNSDIETAEGIDPGRYTAAYERLAECRALASS